MGYINENKIIQMTRLDKIGGIVKTAKGQKLMSETRV